MLCVDSAWLLWPFHGNVSAGIVCSEHGSVHTKCITHVTVVSCMLVKTQWSMNSPGRKSACIKKRLMSEKLILWCITNSVTVLKAAAMDGCPGPCDSV